MYAVLTCHCCISMQRATTPVRGALHGCDSKPKIHEHAAVQLAVTYPVTNKLNLKQLMVPVPGTSQKYANVQTHHMQVLSCSIC